MNYKDFVQYRKNEGYELSIGKAISDSFKHFGKKPGFYILYFIVFIVLSIAASMVGVIPVVGGLLIGSFITPALIMGFATYARQVQLTENPPFEHFFDAFKLNYKNLVLVNFIFQAFGLLIMTLIVTPLIGDFQILISEAGNDPEAILDIMTEIMASVEQNAWPLAGATFLLMLIQLIYSMANYFVIFYEFNFWEAMEASRMLVGRVLFSLVGLYFVAIVLSVLAIMISFGIATVVVIPVLLLLNFAVFEQIAGMPEQGIAIEDDFHI